MILIANFFLLIFIIWIDLILAKSKGFQRRCKKTRCPDWSASWATKRKTWQLEKNVSSYFHAIWLQICKRKGTLVYHLLIIVIQCIVVILNNKLVWSNYIMSSALCSTMYEITKIYLTILILTKLPDILYHCLNICVSNENIIKWWL